MLRRLIADFKEFPATMSLCASWVVVFALMVVTEVRGHRLPSWESLMLGLRGGHSFGDMTLNDLARGEYWRLVTATFVHYGILHVGMNLYGMYLLGSMVESWYGPGQFVAIYGLMGGGGNMLSWLARSSLNRWVARFPPQGAASGLTGLLRDRLYSNPEIPSGGGSVVVLGLVALCAVVGWRSRTRFGDYLRSQMVGVLIFTALLGQAIPIIDNWGHAGGALVGAVIAFAHRTLIRTVERPVARWAGVLGTAVLAACGAAQWWDDRAEALTRHRQLTSALDRLNHSDQILKTLQDVSNLYRQATSRRVIVRGVYMPLDPEGASQKAAPGNPAAAALSRQKQDRQAEADLKKVAELLGSLSGTLGKGPTAYSFRRVVELLKRPFADTPTLQEYNEFESRLQAISRIVLREKELAWQNLLALQRVPRPH
jgi:rhomboid protease GluP